ncbi:MAG: 23S rRNA (uracil(1939)-C(5))-methyltransferase RlmD, partial [Acidobacteria bacterium]|nr:23S rRNA (uracil(1939)-C(5))-methyltransferase RlmD [Acidobacteriota bacterium]NIM62204.1 23S rRNA (uracil(1939)-C(5))-methyltransferase RlmD [Acidobacteriota bacterium]NIO59823.1 23S rRNA (uracil(1939)-C(5))-methyltransferase RlmD [Acidobacteriota bacterium]NIQ30906.1 23S rRNA (uracil(1939)-C(5))-methyltransferase RlmD [Acidobacteriota bacterium]NIQ85982.1 23S rRNA (uracil(1939)-C(5))-methyltransferase RlmD [Acidobacteriota bacterium]
DRLWARAERIRPRFVEGVVVRVDRPADVRRSSPCPHQSRCGGCAWMPLAEEHQRDWKRRLVVDALQRISGIADPRVDPLRRPSTPLAYRNRVEFSAGPGPDGAAAIGLWGRIDGERGLVDLPDCALQDATANALLASIREFVAARDDVGRALAEQGPFRILLRSSSAGRRLVGLWGTTTRFPFADELASRLTDQADSVVSLRARPGRRGGVRAEPLHGDPFITERVGGFEFRLPAASFMQVNPAGGRELIDLVLDYAGDPRGRRILDLYGGVGAFGLHLARAGARHVVVCDADRDAVEAGKRAARLAGLRNTRYAHGTVRSYLRSQQGKPADLVIANPPRSGFGRGVAPGILGLTPARVLIVSCDPPTLARDVQPFLEAGYALDHVTPVDLFPQTHHVETVALLTAHP